MTNTNVPDFVFSVYQDWELCKRLVHQIRVAYPGCMITAVTDGTHDPRFERFCSLYGVAYVPTDERLKLTEHGGRWLERLLDTALLYSASPHLIKVEGDTILHREFRSFPEADCGGTISERYGWKFPRGGCVYFRRAFAKRILLSEFLNDPIYCHDRRFWYGRYSAWRYPWEEPDSAKIALADLILASVLHRLGVEPIEWDEVNIQFRDPPAAGDFAATHPHQVDPGSFAPIVPVPVD